MNAEVCILDLTSRGVQVCLGEDGSPFWLPRSAPGMVWASPPEIGDVTYVRLPLWLVAKHRQLQDLRLQRAFAFQQPLGLDPERAKGALPMADYPQEIGNGALFKNRGKSKPSQPDYFGPGEINGKKVRISAWLKDSKKNPGQKYLSLSFRPDEAQEQRQQQQTGEQSRTDETIPF